MDLRASDCHTQIQGTEDHIESKISQITTLSALMCSTLVEVGWLRKEKQAGGHYSRVQELVAGLRLGPGKSGAQEERRVGVRAITD